MTGKNCDSCKHNQVGSEEFPCNECVKVTLCEPIMEENKEPDYRFNQNIIDALRDGKTVWYFGEGLEMWIEVNKDNINQVRPSKLLDNKWSLTKPKELVKKKIERWANVYQCLDKSYSFATYATEEGAEINGKLATYIATAVPFVLEWEQEE